MTITPRGISIRDFGSSKSLRDVVLRLLVYVIQRYMEQREALAKTVQRQRDDLLKDMELAVQVQRLFLPRGKPVIAGLEMAGMIQPARGVSGDYYDYIPIDAHTIQIIIADVAGKGVSRRPLDVRDGGSHAV